jgi:hypothetical protein
MTLEEAIQIMIAFQEDVSLNGEANEALTLLIETAINTIT